ncbi:MAG: adenosylcobinamide-GDP ribazoletransferase, partial [Actinomycetota bacterium]|nr:adenosylcobinamide-GDP ribazoletransferase [Actinomycetota bacterium]
MRRAFGFLTVVGGARPPEPATLRWFPMVGAMVGLVVGAVWWGAGRLWPPLVAAVLAVVADLALTGMLHVDGLADSADGLLAPMPRARRLEVMATPDVGAFGVTVVAVVLLARVAGLDATKPAPLLIAGLWCASRTLMAAAVTVLPYAR